MRNAGWNSVLSITDTLSGMSSWPGHVYGYQLAEASNIVLPTLQSAGPFTIFMPLDSAFESLNFLGIGSSSYSAMDELLHDSSASARLFLDHIAVGHVDIEQMSVGDSLVMVSAAETYTLVSDSPTYRFRTETDNHWTEFEVVDSHGDPLNGGYLCTNGMVYFVDQVVVGSWDEWQAVANDQSDNDHNGQAGGDHNDNNCDLILFSASEIAFTDDAEETFGCGKYTEVEFTANDGCGNEVSEVGTFLILDTTPPEINQAQFVAWLDSAAGASARDTCQPDDSLVWGNDYDSNKLLPAECDHESLNAETCNCVIEVEFCIYDCTIGNTFIGVPPCTTATFSLFEQDASPVINPDDECPGMDLEHPCDPRCPGYDNFWEFDARVAMTHWIDEQACLCAEDCTDVQWHAVNVPTGLLCGASGVVTFVATDETGNTATKDQYYNFPQISPTPDYCESTPYGCCPGTQVARLNEEGANCPCSSTLYGCCSDALTAKEDSRGNNCYDPVPPPPEPGCTICSKTNKNKPKDLTIMYIAGPGANENEQGSKSYGDLYATYPTSAS
eukprot:gene26741-33894_t